MRRPRLVIADDDTRLLSIVSSLLEQFFEIAGSATDGEAALNAVLDIDPDVLVVDLSMPIMNGVEVAKCLRQLNHRVRVVLLTVLEGLEDVLRRRVPGPPQVAGQIAESSQGARKDRADGESSDRAH